jgi:YbbR domain-containing protein
MKLWIKELLLENWNLKATSLFLALILWIFVRGELGPERIITVPLEVRMPRQMEIVNKRPASIEVTMRGAPVSNLWFSQPLPTCVIDLQKADEGEHIVPLAPGNIKISQGSGIEILQVNPARVTIILEATVSKEIPIVTPVRGEPINGFEVYGKSSKPSSIIISGPRSRIAEIRDVHTAPVSLQGRSESCQFFVDLNLRDSSIRTSVQNPVLVEFSIGPARQLHRISGVPVEVDDNAFSVTPKQIEIQVLAKPDLLADITPMSFRASVSTKAAAAAESPIRIKPAVQILNDFGGTLLIKAIHPSTITVRQKK